MSGVNAADVVTTCFGAFETWLPGSRNSAFDSAVLVPPYRFLRYLVSANV